MKLKKGPIGIAAIIIVTAALLLFISGAVTEISNKFKEGKVESGNTVKVEYTGSFENGTIFDSSEIHGQPLEFQAGSGQMIKGFDQAVIGMKVGEEKTITLSQEDAYGSRNPELIAAIPKEELPEGKPVKPGMMILVGSQNGQQIPALITEVNENNFTIDLNHPLSGKALVFKIKVVDIIKK
ncbi:MAG: peptidylprolyl isomerase [Nanoarchaeota archaeon]